MGFFTSASDALQEALIDQERQRRQAMLDAIAAEDRKLRDEDRKTNREIQRENMESQRLAREEAAAANGLKRAETIVETAGPNGPVDASGAALVRKVGLGGSLRDEDAVLASTALSGVVQPTGKAPVMVGGMKRTQNAGHDARTVSLGTSKQQEEERKRKRRAEYIQSLSAGRERSFLEAQDATGDASLPAEFLRDRDADADRALEDKKELLRLAAELRPPREVRARYEVRPGTTKDGKDALIRTNVDSGEVEIIPLDGVKLGAPQKPTKTPEQIFKEREAAAGGTAAGKKSAAGGGVLSAIADVFKPQAPAGDGVIEFVRDANGKLVRKQ